MRLRVAILFLGAVLLAPSIASAQEAMTDEVYQLNSKSVAAQTRGEYERSVRLLQEAIGHQPLNVLYLNLGRAYARWGKCKLAKQAYDKVPGATAVDSPPRDKVLEVLYRYRLELDKSCAAKATTRQTTAGNKSNGVVLHRPAPKPKHRPPTIALVFVGAGGAALAAAIVLDQVLVKPARGDAAYAAQQHDKASYDQARSSLVTARAINLTVLGVGVAAGATGAVLWALDATRDDHAVALVPTLQNYGAGVALCGHF